MIKITPALLESNLEELVLKLGLFLKIGNIDIDIASKPFVENNTVDIDQVLDIDVLKKYSKIGFHLMVQNPVEDILKIVNKEFLNDATIYVHQESELDISELPFEKINFGVVVKLESELKDLDFYNHFLEVQFMSVESGFQGGKFDEKVLDKVDRLRMMGYNGVVSIDGGVNLESAKSIVEHDINRVSVGSYLSKSEDIQEAYENLDKVLNRK